MDPEVLKCAEKLIPKTYVQQASEAKTYYTNKLRILLEKQKCPDEGWDDSTIEFAVKELCLMDSNNFKHNSGVGEREARIYSGLVSRRHFSMGHGIGRSGNLTDVQPKAAGSSLIYILTNSMTLHIIKESGAPSTSSCLVVPMATGMTLTMCLLTCQTFRPQAKYVIWPRVDQKSALKCIHTAGYIPLIIENILVGDELQTDMAAIENCIAQHCNTSIAAVITTTSCFAPRAIDKLEEVAKLCAKHDIPHLINNAYGLQSYKCMHHIQQASRIGRVDAFIQSTDKNLMVPVGGAIIGAFKKDFIDAISQIYPGRASSSPILDVFITLLSMGMKGYKKLLQQRKHMKELLMKRLQEFAAQHGCRVLLTKNNPISIGLGLPSLCSSQQITELGSMLFIRGVSGTRVLCREKKITIMGHTFEGWGCHYSVYPSSYLTAAAAIGMTEKDIDLFIERLHKCFHKFSSKVGCFGNVQKVQNENVLIKDDEGNNDAELRNNSSS